MTDVFLCSCANDWVRIGLREGVDARWSSMADSEHTLVTPTTVGCSNLEFQGMRRPYIEARSQSDIYIMAEDDCMPLGPNFIERGLEIMARHPDFAVLSPLLLPYPETPSMWQDDEVYEGITSGGINFTRKGALKDLKVEPGVLFDESSQAGYLKRLGWRVGWMKHLKQNHLGAGLSTIWPDPYTGKTQVSDL